MSAFQKQRLLKGIMTVIMLGIGVLMILPFLWMLSSSLKPEGIFFYSADRMDPEDRYLYQLSGGMERIVPFSLFTC